jgi:hypothetical protein
MKLRSVGTEFIHADGRTDGHNGHFSRLYANAPKNSPESIPA